MGSKPFRVKHVTQIATNKLRFEKSLKESLVSTTENPNCELLLAYYASEVSMNKKIKALFEIIFAHDENEVYEINLSYVSIDLKSAYHLKIILQYFSNTQILKLSKTGLDSKNIKRLTRSMPSLSKLTAVHLDGNCFNLNGISLICRFFKYWPRVKILNLSENSMDFQMFSILCKGIKELPELTEVYLNWNQAEDESAGVIAEAVNELECLQVFEIAGNGLSCEGIRSIIRGFKESVLSANFSKNLVSKHSVFLLKAKYAYINFTFD